MDSMEIALQLLKLHTEIQAALAKGLAGHLVLKHTGHYSMTAGIRVTSDVMFQWPLLPCQECTG